MLLLGLTGDIACGKSTVAALLRGYGAAHIDADALVRELYEDAEFSWRVQALFREQILGEGGRIDRRRLGELAFGNPAMLRRLELIVHPAVATLRDDRIEALRRLPDPPPAAVLEAVKLIESGQSAQCDAVWCVICKPEVQIERMMRSRGLSEAEARARLSHQPSAQAKHDLLSRQGDIPLILIPNDGTPDELRARVEEEWKKVPSAQ